MEKDGMYLAPQLDYKAKPASTPDYHYTRLLPLSGGQSQTVGVGATQEVLFEIPDKVWNPSRTFLSYGLQIPQQGAGIFTWVPMDTFSEISQIQLLSRGGVPIADILYANNYLKLVSKLMPRPEYNDMIVDEGLVRSNTVATANTTAAPSIYQANGAAGGTPPTATENYSEPQYLQVSQAANGVWPVAGGVQQRQLKLGRFKGTIFELDIDIHFPQTMQLRVVFSGAKVGWGGTSNVNPATGTAALTGNIAISTLSVYQCIEKRDDVVKAVMDKAKAGWDLPVPFLWYVKTPLTGASQAFQVRLSASQGKFCRKIVLAPFAQSEQKNYSFDHSNILAPSGLATDGGKILSYYTTLDSDRIQQFDITCCPVNTAGANGATYPSDDYNINRPMLTGSVIQSRDMYRLNWMHIEDFMGGLSPLEGQPRPNVIGGLDLSSGDRLYTFYAQNIASDSAANAVGLNWYAYPICMRTLHIKGGEDPRFV